MRGWGAVEDLGLISTMTKRDAEGILCHSER